jgi:3-dehydroquinate synthase
MKIDVNLNKTIDESYVVLIDELPNLSFNSKVAVITNETIAPLHLQKILPKIKADEIVQIVLPDGEEYKKMPTIETILNALFEARFDRSCTLIAFGGGVIGDMTGFAAALFERGIDFIQIPTTLLSAVDASVGGKTGINNKYGKNLIGSFNQPKAVYIDIDFLSTLPKREFAAGMAEAIKMGVMFDREYFDFLLDCDLTNKATFQEAIGKSVALKAKVVSEDEKEKGIRAVLNYGHTFAHVIENETNYAKYLHGEAVAIGMVMANTLANKLGLLSENEAKIVQNALEKQNLPTKYKISNVDGFYDKFFLDKKTERGRIKFILPNGIGDFKIVSDIDEQTVKNSLREFTGK